MNLWKRPFSVIKKHGVDALMPHAIQVRQTGDPEVPNWTRVRRLARELKQQDLGDPASRQITNAALSSLIHGAQLALHRQLR
jgi:hypothetical protein